MEEEAQKQLQDRALTQQDPKPILRAAIFEPDIVPFAVETSPGVKESIAFDVSGDSVGFINRNGEHHGNLVSLFDANQIAQEKRDKMLKRSEWKMYPKSFEV